MLRYSRVYTESGLSEEDQRYSQRFIFLDNPDTRYQYVTPNRWNRMRQVFCKYFSIDIDMMKHLRPMFIMAAIQKSILGETGDTALDQAIWQFAVEHNLSVQGIETAQEQVDIMLSLPMRPQYTALVRLSQKISGQRKKMLSIIKYYQEQRVKELYQMSSSQMRFGKVILIHQRNQIIANRIFDWHQEKPSFFSFGAGHLAGKNGVIHLLRKKGALVTPYTL